ncbi:MAG TPA: hypothetical protein VKB88_30635 [Bryobacteraceae bacterium]|nr:hypothetical protein [Bryobacteraceae bacterium]
MVVDLEVPPSTEAAADSTFREQPWLVFQYAPVALFSLKMARATSTAGKSLLIPTPYAAKMGFVDVVLRHGLTGEPDRFITGLAKCDLRIGTPLDACITSTIQAVRQETRDEDRKRRPDLPPYRPNIAMRDVVHWRGVLRLAFDVRLCDADVIPLLIESAPAINYFGKRGSFVQYLGASRLDVLDGTYTRPFREGTPIPLGCHRAALDDFGSAATFAALNTFSNSEIRSGVDRSFVDTVVPLAVHNFGAGFVHYRGADV